MTLKQEIWQHALVDSASNPDDFVRGAQWMYEKMMKDAVEATVTEIRAYKEENEVDFTVMYDKGINPFEIEDEVKLIIIKEK